MIVNLIQTVARRRGIENANQLALAIDVPANLAVRLWSDNFQRFDRDTLDKLCAGLKCQPGTLFKYQESESVQETAQDSDPEAEQRSGDVPAQSATEPQEKR